ncbi:MAG TPA: CPBP family intramembrane glutamic endopeptidase [Opitutaceae bacterium]
MSKRLNAAALRHPSAVASELCGDQENLRMMNHPLLLAGAALGGLYVAKLWRDDLRAAEAGQAKPGALPGATRASRSAIVIAATGALMLLALETAGELALGIATEQSRMTWLFALYSICGASVIEELIFRGYLVMPNRGRAVLWAGIVAASALFALLHPYLWTTEGGFRLTLTTKGIFSTAILFASSLWFYAARFGPWNPTRSLLPCFAAHAAKNAGVVAIKAAMGYMGGAW